ncbi:MAG: hypothetical protein IJ651_02740 [Bacteroidales bacterium]|nr:hypothetical protein [Bacteroidales bacterium]
MASITDIIMQQVKNSASSVNIPSNVKDQVLGGLGDSILGSLTQTVAKPGGIDLVKGLLTGTSDASTSPITKLAGSLFNSNILSKLNLGSLGTTLSGLIPVIMGKLGGILKDQDGDGDVDLNDIILALKGGGSANSGASILGAATSILGGLGGLFGKK